jgi:hypothetical protein
MRVSCKFLGMSARRCHVAGELLYLAGELLYLA